MLAQAETVLIEKALEELSKRQATGDGGLYVFALVIVIIGCGAFYVLRYMMGHTKEIHAESQKSISEISERSHQISSKLSETFSNECRAQRDQHHRDLLMARDMSHAMRDVAGVAINSKDFADRMQKKEEELKKKYGIDSAEDEP